MNEHAPRILHTMLRARDLDTMLGFYCGTLGMREIRRIEFPESHTLVFIGYGNSKDEAQVELWHDHDRGTEPAAAGAGAYGHIGIGVRDIEAYCKSLAASGVRILREPAPMRPGGRVIAIIEDPEHNEIELLAND